MVRGPRVDGLLPVFRDEGVYEAGDGGRPDLLCMGELAEGEWSGEDDNGEGGQARGIEAAGGVGVAQFAQQMNGGRMKGLGGILGFRSLALDMGGRLYDKSLAQLMKWRQRWQARLRFTWGRLGTLR